MLCERESVVYAVELVNALHEGGMRRESGESFARGRD